MADSIKPIWEIVSEMGATIPKEEWDKVRKECHWTYDDYLCAWDTGCKNCFQFTEDGPHQNKFAYCPYCGLPIVIVVEAEKEVEG